MVRRTHTKRPVISAPIGPVRHLEGIVIGGTDALQLVYRSNDCAGIQNNKTSNPSTSSDSLATVVESEVSDLTRMQASNSSKASLGKKSALLSLSRRSSTKHQPKYTLSARPEPTENAGNIPSFKGSSPDKNSSIPRSMSKWHKSKTLAVLHELKKPFARKSLAAVRSLSPDHLPPPRDITTRRQPDESEGRVSGFRSSESTLASFPRTDSRPSSPLDTSPWKKMSPEQSVAYWTGRFMALRDRFFSETLNDGSSHSSSSPSHSTKDNWQTRLPLPSRSSRASHDRLAYLAPSNTTSALPTATYDSRPRPPDDKDVLQRVCEQLESSCTTQDARRSFCLWKDYYALKYLQKEFSDDDEYMDDKSQKNGLLAGVGNRFNGDERRREPTIKELTNSRSGAIGITPGRGVAAY